MATRLSDAARNAQVNAITALLGGGTVQVRSGSQPANVATAATGTLLGTLTLAATAFANASGGSATANAVTDATGAVAGTAGWFRVLNSSGTAVLDGAVGASGSGAELILSTTTITANGTIKITSWTISVP